MELTALEKLYTSLPFNYYSIVHPPFIIKWRMNCYIYDIIMERFGGILLMNSSEEESRKKNILKEIKEYGLSIMVALFLAFIFHTYVLARASVDGPSMQPTLHNNDVIFLEKLSVETNNIKRGEIIVFDSKNENNDYYIKRVIGVAGDQVDIKNGKVYVNGNQIVENYLSPDTITEPISPKTTYKVPEGQVFVLGDNRSNSTDSRILGCINVKDVKGHAILRAYPFNQIRIF